MIRIKQKTANVWEHTNGNIVNIAIIANVVHLLKTSSCLLNLMNRKQQNYGNLLITDFSLSLFVWIASNEDIMSNMLSRVGVFFF